MSGESDSDFVKTIEELLTAGDTSAAKAVFRANEDSDNIKTNCWDLISTISKFLSPESRRVHDCCLLLLNRVADVSNPEEALLQLIEEIEESDSDVKFAALLEPLRRALVRVNQKTEKTEKSSVSLAWGFASIKCYLDKHDAPATENLKGKEKMLLDNIEDYRSIDEMYKSIERFVDLLTREISFDSADELLPKFIVRLLGNPLVYLDVEIFDGIKNGARVTSERLVESIRRDPIRLLNYNNEMIELDKLGVSSLFYLIFHENICIEIVPKVYDRVYFFQRSLHLVTVLLDVNHQIVVEKGLKLAESLLERIPRSKLPYYLLDHPDHPEFCKALAKVIVYNDSECLRKAGLNVYRSYLNGFETRGFYFIVYNFISDITHSGLKAFTISMYKNLVVESFDNIYVKGPKLFAMLEKFCQLHKKEESDLIELSDEIISTLNLIRYLIIRDKSNSTQIWNFIPDLRDMYFEPLRKGLDLSRAHYEHKIREIDGENRKMADVNVLVKGESLSELSRTEKLDVLNRSLTVFDVIDSLLCRVNECIELQDKFIQ